MSLFKFEVLKARHGDCLLLRTDSTTILIDGGPSSVYEDFLKPHLEAVQQDNDEQESVFIDLLLVSHIDEDHVLGLIDLTQEMIERDDQDEKQLVEIDQVWYNSFDDTLAKIVDDDAGQVTASATEVVSLAGTSISISVDLHDSKVVLESVSQGRQLRDALERLNVRSNQQFQDNLVLNSTSDDIISVGDINFKIIGPSQKQLDDLEEEWKTQLPEILKKEQDEQVATAAAEKLDKSVFNLASIVVIAEKDGKSILLTGDARGDLIIDWLIEKDELAEGGTRHFNVLKLPHHGSTKNIEPGFFTTITADHYVISGNGRYGNPEQKVLGMLFEERGFDKDYKVYLTYTLDEMDERAEFDKTDFEQVFDAHPLASERVSYIADDELMLMIEL